jgi:hypothetical protein
METWEPVRAFLNLEFSEMACEGTTQITTSVWGKSRLLFFYMWKGKSCPAKNEATMLFFKQLRRVLQCGAHEFSPFCPSFFGCLSAKNVPS